MKPLEPVLVLDMFPDERDALLGLLSELSDEEWARPTACAGWSVKDVALHILGGDVGRLSRKRDGFPGAAFVPAGDRDFEAELLDYINDVNARWVEGTRRISPRLLCDLLRFTGEQVQSYFQSLDLFQVGEPVSWAGPEPAPVWLDVAREYTEYWHHQQQIRDATGRPGLVERRFFAPVLETFARALPHSFQGVRAPVGAQVSLVVSGEAGGAWSLVHDGDGWRLYRGPGTEPSAFVTIDQETAWRLFTKGLTPDEASAVAAVSGDRALAMRVLDTVAIIA